MDKSADPRWPLGACDVCRDKGLTVEAVVDAPVDGARASLCAACAYRARSKSPSRVDGALVALPARTDAAKMAGVAALVSALQPAYRSPARGGLMNDARAIGVALDRDAVRVRAVHAVSSMASTTESTARAAVEAWNEAVERATVARSKPSDRRAWRAASARRSAGGRS